MSEERIRDFAFAVAVDALVEPGFFKFIGGDHAVPILVAKLVGHRDVRAEVLPRRLPPCCFAGDERGVLHSTEGRVWFGINQRDLLVRIGSIPFIEFLHALFQGGEIAVALVGMGCKYQPVQLHRAKTVHKHIVDDLKVGRGGPGKVVYIFAAEAQRPGAIGVGLFGSLDAAGAHNITLGKGEVDVVGAEVGKEFCIGVVLMAVPRAVPKNAHLGEPLGAHDEVALVSISGNGEGELVVKRELKAHHLMRPQRFGKGDFHDCAVVLIAIIGSDKPHRL